MVVGKVSLDILCQCLNKVYIFYFIYIKSWEKFNEELNFGDIRKGIVEFSKKVRISFSKIMKAIKNLKGKSYDANGL